MNCKFAKINGSNCLVNFLTKDDRMAMMVQKMDKKTEIVELSKIEVSDLDGGTLIVNSDICIQMSVEEATYVYTRFNIIRK